MAHPENSYCYPITHIPLSEFDLGGVLYHARYFHLYERAREQFLIDRAIPYPELVRAGSHLAVVESWQSFKQPVLFGPKYQLFLWCEELKKISAKICYEIAADSGVIIHSAWTKNVFVKTTAGQFKTERFPEKLSTALAAVAI